MTARLKLLLKKVAAEIATGKTFDEAVLGYLLTPAEVEELRVATATI